LLESEIGEAEGGVGEAVAEPEERCLPDFVVVPVSDVNVFAVEDAATIGAVA
jgi:hypothetical protein